MVVVLQRVGVRYNIKVKVRGSFIVRVVEKVSLWVVTGVGLSMRVVEGAGPV